MKKLISLLALSVAFGAGAATYPYMTFRFKDGSTRIVDSSGLRFYVNEGRLSVSHSGGDVSFAISDLASMAFSAGTDAVESVGADHTHGVEVFNAQGMCLGRFDTPKDAEAGIGCSGMYLFKTDKGTSKIIIKK